MFIIIQIIEKKLRNIKMKLPGLFAIANNPGNFSLLLYNKRENIFDLFYKYIMFIFYLK